MSKEITIPVEWAEGLVELAHKVDTTNAITISSDTRLLKYLTTVACLQGYCKSIESLLKDKEEVTT